MFLFFIVLGTQVPGSLWMKNSESKTLNSWDEGRMKARGWLLSPGHSSHLTSSSLGDAKNPEAGPHWSLGTQCRSTSASEPCVKTHLWGWRGRLLRVETLRKELSWPGIEPGPELWKCGILATRPPGSHTGARIWPLQVITVKVEVRFQRCREQKWGFPGPKAEWSCARLPALAPLLITFHLSCPGRGFGLWGQAAG